jgi:hypothetical protein
MTSDHRVAGSSPAGCKSNPRADWQSITIPNEQQAKMLVIAFLSFTRHNLRRCADKSVHFIWDMKPETKLKLTKRNAAAIDKYAALVGLTPQKLWNRFLEDFLTDFWDDDKDNGNAAEYLGRFTFKDRGTAERLAAWMLYFYRLTTSAFLAQFFACTIFFTAPVLAREMPWNREVTVTAHVMWRKGRPALKFAEPLDFRTDPADPEDTGDLKNVRVVPVVAEFNLDFRLLEKVIKSGRPITVTGSFKHATNVHQPGPLFFGTESMNKALAQALQRAPAPATPWRAPAPGTPWYNQPWAQPEPQYNAAQVDEKAYGPVGIPLLAVPPIPNRWERSLALIEVHPFQVQEERIRPGSQT